MTRNKYVYTLHISDCAGDKMSDIESRLSVSTLLRWDSTRENLSSGFANNKGADKPAHLRSLISAFVILLLESI